MKQMKLFIAIVTGILLAGTSVVQAQDITAEGRAQERQARIEQYKQTVTDRLSAAEQTRIAGVCSTAQTRVERLQSGFNAAINNRQRTYESLVDKLALVSDQIQLTGVDTAVLDTYITQMQLDAQEIVSSMSLYQQVLADVAGIDCEADVDGFQSALTVARTTRGELKSSSQELRVYINETIRPEIESLKLQIVDNTTEGQ